MEIVALIAASLLFLAGIIGSFAPVLPGAPLIWAGMLVYGLITGFAKLDLLFYVLQGSLALAIMGVDYAATALGSRYFGASKAAVFGAVCGLAAGLFFFFPIGLIIGPFLGAMLAELIYSRRTGQAVRSGLGATLGFWGGLFFKLVLAGGMLVWFFARVL
jgi:uncharacterized protein